MRAANKAHEYFQQSVSANDDYFFVKADNKLEKINFKDILFVEALENYVAIQTTDRRIITHLTLTSLKEKLPGTEFIQPHKSFIISIDHINSIEGNIIHINNFKLPISKYQKDDVMEKIVNKKLFKR